MFTTERCMCVYSLCVCVGVCVGVWVCAGVDVCVCVCEWVCAGVDVCVGVSVCVGGSERVCGWEWESVWVGVRVCVGGVWGGGCESVCGCVDVCVCVCVRLGGLKRNLMKPDKWRLLCECYHMYILSIMRSTQLDGPHAFLGAFANLRKATVTLVMSVCLHGTTRFPQNLIFEEFSKICRGNSKYH